MSSLTPDQRSLRSRIAGYSTASRHDPRTYTAPARAAFLARFDREVDPDGVLPDAERTRRAMAARRAYFTRLALASAKARRAAKGARA